LRRDGTHVRTVARGLRQPFQLTFVKGRRYPYVTVLGQDETPKAVPPDFIVVARPGQNYGFAKCTWFKPKACRGYARPKKFLPKHFSPMGIGAIGQRLFVASFEGNGLKPKAPTVVTLSANGGRVKKFLTGFVAPVVGVGTHAGSVYVGELTGAVYRVRG
jgi:glucose/arabinose dehydrogenase